MKLVIDHPYDSNKELEMEWNLPFLPRENETFEIAEFFPEAFDQKFIYYFMIDSVTWAKRNGEVVVFIQLDEISCADEKAELN